MSHEGTLTLLGVLILLAPFLGLPYSWLMVILPLAGLSIITLSIILRARGLKEVVVHTHTVHEEETPAYSAT